MRPFKCERCGAVWYYLNGPCAYCGGSLIPTIEEEDEGRKIAAALRIGCCPDCGSTKLRGGPRGGLSQNVLCEECRAEFNAGVFSERLAAPCDPQRQKDIYGMEAA